MHRIYHIIALMALCSATANAAPPSIMGVAGTISDGQSITISGSDFGSGPNIVLFDDFEKGSDGNDISTGENSAQVGGWISIRGNPKYSNISKISGNLAFRADNGIDYAQQVSTSMPTNTTKWFYSVWVYLSSDDSWPGAGSPIGINWKFLWAPMNVQLEGGLATPVMLGLADSYDWAQFTYAGDSPTGFIAYPDLSMSKGSWYRIWGYVDIAVSGTLQCWDLRESGVHTALNSSTDTSSATYANYFYLNGYARSVSDCHPMFDDIYVSTGDAARARVEIGNNAVYASCTNLTICTVDSWGGSSITATVRQGSFSAGTAYLFVVDSDGAVSDGYEITLGGSTPASGSSCTASGTCNWQ